MRTDDEEGAALPGDASKTATDDEALYSQSVKYGQAENSLSSVRRSGGAS